MLSLLPAFAALIGALVLRQVLLRPLEIGGIGLIVRAVAVYQERDTKERVS